MRPPAIGVELGRAMRARKISGRALARALGYGPSEVSAYRHGHRLPSHPRAVALADILMWPKLAELSLASITRTCVVCGGTFVDGGQQRKATHCTKACYQTERSRRMRAVADARDRMAQRRLAVYQEAVAAFCTACTVGEGLCRNSDCELREVSPLPFVALHRRSA